MAEVIRRMADAGAPPEAIAIAVEAIEAEQNKEAERKAKNAERKASQRARQSQDSHRTVAGQSQDTPAPLTPPLKSPPDPEKITPPISPQPPLSAHSRPERDFFAEFWLAYPRREGANPKKPAALSFKRLLAKGASPERIIEAARALRAQHPAPTPFVPQAVTWLNQERFGDEEPVINGDEFCSEDWPNTRWLKIRFRDERGHDPPPAVQGGKAGVLIPAEWVALSRQASNARLVESR